MPRRVGVRALRGDLSAFLRRAQKGERFEVTARESVVAVLGPPSTSASGRRRFGALRGKVRLAGDFTAPLPAGMLDAFEG